MRGSMRVQGRCNVEQNTWIAQQWRIEIEWSPLPLEEHLEIWITINSRGRCVPSQHPGCSYAKMVDVSENLCVRRRPEHCALSACITHQERRRSLKIACKT